ncbi:MAG: hypothetical protein FJY29_10285 [Betaproteobacteria bacterium]|nr:hypothetical protein [Betaproteobacteria bacterium]
MQTSFASTLLRWATGITLWVGFQAQTSFANDVVWRPELIQAQGVGCRFGHSSDPNQNAYVIANGDSVSFIFTRLGEEFRTGRTPNINLSPCRIILPLEVNAGFYIEEIAQTLTYGIVKSRGVQAQLDFISNFARRLPNGRSNPNDLSQNMANAKAFFPAPQIINEPMAILPQPLARIGEDSRNNSPHRRFCNRERSRLFNYHSDIFVRINRIKPDASIAFSVDGLDLKYEMKMKVKRCRGL